MQVGSLVRLVSDPHEVLGFVVEMKYTNLILIKWMDDLCFTSWHNPKHLEVVCE